MNKIQIKSIWGDILFECEKENNTIKEGYFKEGYFNKEYLEE